MSWQMMPSTHVAMMPSRIAPLTLRSIRIAVIRMPMIARRTVIPSELKVPFAMDPLKENTETSVALSTTMCAFCRPMNVMKRPIPTETAILRVAGIALKIASLTLVRERTTKIRPSTKTAVRAICQE